MDSLTDSNDCSILCFPGQNDKNIPENELLESVFTDCGRTVVAATRCSL